MDPSLAKHTRSRLMKELGRVIQVSHFAFILIVSNFISLPYFTFTYEHGDVINEDATPKGAALFTEICILELPIAFISSFTLNWFYQTYTSTLRVVAALAREDMEPQSKVKPLRADYIKYVPKNIARKGKHRRNSKIINDLNFMTSDIFQPEETEEDIQKGNKYTEMVDADRLSDSELDAFIQRKEDEKKTY